MAEEKSVKAWERELYELAKQGKWEELGRQATLCIEDHPKIGLGYFYRAVARGKFGQFEDALKDYNKAIELHPNDANYFSNRGTTKQELGQFEDALKDHNKAIEIDPNAADYFNNRGVTKQELGQLEDALKDHNKAIEIDPNAADYFNNRGVTKSRLGKLEDALKDHNKAIELDPKKANYFNNRGTVEMELKRYDDAIDDYNKAIEIDPNLTVAFHNRALAAGKQSAEETQRKLTNTFNENISNIFAINKLIGIYDSEVLQCKKRLYGHSYNEESSEDTDSGGGSGDVGSNASGESAKKGNVFFRIFQCLNLTSWIKQATLASIFLIFYVIFEFAFFFTGFCFFDVCEVGFEFPEMPPTQWAQISSALIFLTAPFLWLVRYLAKRVTEEQVRLYALMRDRDRMLVLWNANETDKDPKNRAEYIRTLLEQINTNSAADMALRIMQPKHKDDKDKASIESRLDDLENRTRNLPDEVNTLTQNQQP